ncbi:hypothetical protein F53441_9193 [Fusarium austroafricanum]|uniref:Uncharacterized protein n=1 Tax=Fusarium austroafricanum TaxID=2364996 RepID=A0A8H4K9P6_9HYPO|nr:hypothetical protein F53441_9193 [Fusarium austroafricanum]
MATNNGLGPQIIQALLEKSPESTLTLEKLLEIDNKPPAPEPSEIQIPAFTICCGCMCRSYGMACTCLGEGCYTGVKAHVEIKNTHASWKLQPPRPDPFGPSPPVTLPASQIIKIDKHDFKAFLKAKIAPGYRAAICSFNEKYAMWLHGQAATAGTGLRLRFSFRDPEKEIEAYVDNLVDGIKVDQLPGIDRNDRATIAKGALEAYLSRRAE